MVRQKNISVKSDYDQFVKRVCATQLVYALESDDGFATSDSAELEDEEGEPVQLVFFWSEQAMAEACIKNSWADCRVIEVPLADFMETWCVELNNDGFLTGTDFDWDKPGEETEPLELVLDLGQQLRKNKSGIRFSKFKDLVDLEKQIKAANQ